MQINIRDVEAVILSVGGFDDDAVERYCAIIENAVSTISDMIKDGVNDKRAVYLAAIKACRDISLAEDFEGGVSSFKVGEVSITESSESENAFVTLYKNALEDCKSILKDKGSDFAFMNV